MTLLLFILATVFVLWWLIADRSVRSHPTCAKCGFDIRGLNQCRICPECGHALDARSWNYVFKKRPHGFLVAALVCLLLTQAGDLYTWSTVRLSRIAPTSALFWFADPYGTLSWPDSARSELLRRARAGEMDAAQAKAFLSESLDVARNQPKRWYYIRADLITAMWNSGLLDSAEFASYLNLAIDTRFDFFIHDRTLNWTAFAHFNSFRTSTPFWSTVVVDEVRVEHESGTTHDIPGEFSQQWLTFNSQGAVTFQASPKDFPPGKCTLVARVRMTLSKTNSHEKTDTVVLERELRHEFVIPNAISP